MARRRSRVLDYAVYLIVRWVVCVIQIVPWSWATAFADRLAWLMYHVDRRHRRVAQDNLARAYPDWSEIAVDRMVRRVYRHFCRVMVEMIVLPRKLHRSTVDDHVRYAIPADYDRVLQLVKQDRPLILLTGHFGNWEVLGYSLGLAGYRGAVIARSLDNPWLDHFLKRFRVRTGQRMIEKGDVEQIQEVLANRETLGVLADQDAGARGLFVDFFGRQSSTFKAIALLSLKYQAPIVVMGAARVGEPLEYHLYADVILPDEYAGRSDAVRLITQRYTMALEQMIRRHPEQYFWLHNRWKHQPKERKAKKAA